MPPRRRIQAKKEQPPVLTSIDVRGLFGRLDHRLDLERGQFNPHPNLTLLYGRNGTGKSTLLRIAYHGLSSSPTQGHRTVLAGIPFERAEFAFSNGFRLIYERLEKVVGRRTRTELVVSVFPSASEDPVRESLRVHPSGRIPIDDVDLGPGSVTDRISNLRLDPIILTDTRRIFSDSIEDEREEQDEDYAPRTVEDRPEYLDALVRARRDDDLVDSIRRLEEYFRWQTILAERSSAGDADQGYASIVRTIATNAQGPGRPRKTTLPALDQRLETLADRSDVFRRYDLITGLQFQDLRASIAKAPDRAGPLLLNVLQPYLDGLEARMNSLQETVDSIDAYTRLVNGFLEGKELRYSALTRKLSVHDSSSGAEIRALDLSSGEKQLVLLFSYVMSMRRDTRLLLIDEPEISLNPDWQRGVIPALLRLINGAPVQLVCASHSIEILAPFDENVVEMSAR